MTERFANNAFSTLNGAINNSTTSVILNDASSFPNSGNFRIIMGTNPSGSEIMLVTGVSGNTFTVVRGYEGTSANSWSDGYLVTHILTAGGLNQALTAGGDLSGTVENSTVIKINGTTVPSTPSANQVLIASSGTSSIWSQIYDGYVASSAAIAGTKISPNFGSQNIVTTGSVSSGSLTSTSVNTGLLSVSGKQIFIGLNSVPAVSNTGEGNIYFDLSLGKFRLSENGGSYGILGVDGYFGSTNITTTGSINSGSITSTSLTTSQNILSGKLIANGITTSVASASGQGVIYFDSSQNRFYLSENGGSYVRFLSDGYSAGGDLTGTYPNPTVAKIRGNNIASQTLGASQDGYVLSWSNADGYWKANLGTNSILSDGYANIPAANTAGRLFLPTDSVTLFRDNGTTWNSFGPIYSFNTPDSTSSFTKINSTSATLSDSLGTLVYTSTLTNEIFLHANTLGSTFQIDVAYETLWNTGNSGEESMFALALLNGSTNTSSFKRYGVYWSSNTLTLQHQRFTAIATASTVVDTLNTTNILNHSGLIWLRVIQDSTNITFYFSNNGVDYRQFSQEAKSSFITPTRWGLFTNTSGGNTTIHRIYSLKVQ